MASIRSNSGPKLPPSLPKSTPEASRPASAPPAPGASGASSFVAASRPRLDLSGGAQPPASTLRTERLGDGQANCLERAHALARPGDTVLLCQGTRDASGHALVVHRDGSVTDPNLPGVRYPDLGSLRAQHPQYQPGARIPQAALASVLSVPPGPARDARISALGLGSVASVVVADTEDRRRPDGRTLAIGVNLRVAPGTGQEKVLDTPMPSGASVEVLDYSGDHPGWARVRYTDGQGVTHEGWAGVDLVNEDTGEPYSTRLTARDVPKLNEANGLYINQFSVETQIGGDGSNANCGPVSLTVAFAQQGLVLPPIPGLADNGTDGAMVQRARFAMYGADPAVEGSGNASLDGTVPLDDANGNAPGTEGWEPTYGYADLDLSREEDGENSQFTSLPWMERAVKAAGGHSESVTPLDADGIQAQLEAERTVIVQGTSVDDTGTHKAGLWPQHDSTKEHFISVTGMTDDGRFIVCDSAADPAQAVLVTGEQLELFMQGHANALAIGGTDEAPAS